MRKELQPVSCLIPFYNEGTRIFTVLRVLLQTRAIEEIICIDDGSTDGVAMLIQKNYPSVRVLRLEQNTGKTEAIAKGVEAATGEIVLLMDADIEGIRTDEVERAILAMQKFPSLSMLILRRMKPMDARLSRSDIVICGERILRRTDLEEVLQKRPTGFQLETAINQYMMEQKKTVCWMQCSTIHRFPKKDKRGLYRGLSQEVAMFWSSVSYAGILQYVEQFVLFCWRELRD